MSVSRETSVGAIECFNKHVNNSSSYRVSLKNQEDALPFFLSLNPGSFLVVQDSSFMSVFNSLYRSGLPLFSVLTNIKIDSPVGFVSPLKRAVDSYIVYEQNPQRIVLVNMSCFEGSFPYYFDGNIFKVDLKTTYEDLVCAIESSSLIRVSTVVGPGTYAKRGSLLDIFPPESTDALRVDFSHDNPKIFVFDTVSQLTLKEIFSFSFIISKPSYSKVKTKDLLRGLQYSSYLSGSFVLGSGDDLVSLSICKYSSYGDFSNSFVCSDFLHSAGLYINGFLFIPTWFVGGAPPKKVLPVATSLIDGFEGLVVGGFLVHEEYGVCRFDGIIEGVDNDESSVVLVFRDGKILLPVSRLFLLSIYSGEVGTLDSLSKRGLWLRKRGAVSKKINDFVKHLLDQHLSRISSIVSRNKLDVETLSSFVAAFKYQDTKDQAQAFQDILEDMSSPSPMDRLLCGDVGFGKTEIAIRAVFLSVLLGRRAVVLAPTTVLCRQLFDSFSSRLAPFAVNVEMVSRLSSTSQVNKNIKNFNLNKVDVLVCTHKIFTYIETLKDVGLLVVDEEHRFGVKQKELFVDTFPNIDILLMSATPIPRSLQGALSGIKTMSTIATPPINRLPIQTTIDYFNDDMIADYINYEVSRSGQVYFLHNNIRSLGTIRRLLSKICPNVSVEVVHGQMSSKNIEKTVFDFSCGNFQVLISTTIIENGLDISNVNTIIINNAHLFGLSQLHQIRGRVGRHSRQAFAYLLIPKTLHLKPGGKKRLKAIEENISLGSGYNLSSRDLELRGAGSIFGYNQSGGSRVGFGLYNKILKDSIDSLRGFVDRSIDSVVVNFYIEEAFIPRSYIEEPGLRISVYKSILGCSSLDDLENLKSFLVNRFGKHSDEMALLFQTQKLRVLCLGARVFSVVVNSAGARVVFLPGKHIDDPPVFVAWVSSFFNSSGWSFSFKRGVGNKVEICFDGFKNKKDIYVFLKDLLNKFKQDFLENK